jgi:type I restriction enzyme S subunit
VKLPSYPKYKPSGVDWLGDVPEHWEVKPLKRELRRSASGGGLIKGEMASEPGEGLFQGFSASGPDVWVDEAHYSEAGVVLSAVGARCGKVFKADGQWTAVANTHVFFPEVGRSRDYLWYLLNNEEFWEKGGTAQPYVRVPATLNRAFVFAPTTDQAAIAAFLDRETGRMDRLVAKKRELIERLKEKRTALISRTVTHGLNPNAKLKPSGVPWFDEYPIHWQTKRLRHISNIIVVGVVVNPSSYVTDEGVVFLLGGDVREMLIDTTDCKRCSPESSNGPLVKSRLDAGDLVVVRVGYPGVAAVVPSELAGGNVASMMLVRKHPRYCSQWLAYAFNSQVGRDQVEIVQYGAAQKQFNISHAVDFAFPFPPLPEQIAIAAYLDLETAKLDALLSKVETAIERLQEYRTALITAAVTGKIDVRKAAA